MSDLKLSTISILLGLIVALPSVYGLLNPKGFAEAARRFPRNTAAGWVLMLLGTVWFLYYVSQETVSDFANLKKIFYVLFGGVGLGTCLFVKDFLPVRGLAVVFLLAAKLMTDAARNEDTPWSVFITTWAYAWVLAGIWFTVSPYRLRDLINWAVATDTRTRLFSAVRVALGVGAIALGLTVYKAAEQRSATAQAATAPSASQSL